MKKIILIILLFTCITGVIAQNFKGGLRVGFTGTQISGDKLSGFNKMGAYAGGFVNWPFPNHGKWALQMEINFIMKGTSKFLIADKENYIGDKYVLTMCYTETPILAKYRLIKGLEVEFGPSINFLFYAVEKDANGKMPARQPFRLCELSVIGGMTYLFKEHYGLNLRYSNSILPVRVNDGNHSDYRLDRKQFNSAIAFSFFYHF